MARKYIPFIIRIKPKKGKEFPVQAAFLETEVDDVILNFFSLIDHDTLEKSQGWLEDGRVDETAARDIGSQLFKTLPMRVRSFLRQALQFVGPEGGVRIMLDLPDDLEALPWEWMYDEEGYLGFLARSEKTPLVRYDTNVRLGTDAYSFGFNKRPEQGPLRVLVVTASPKDHENLDYVKEIHTITKSLNKPYLKRLEALKIALGYLRRTRSINGFFRHLLHPLVEIDVYSHATINGLENKMREADNGQGYHVVHFIGHAGVKEGESIVYLEDEDSLADPVTAVDFVEKVNKKSVNLIVLNACETARFEPGFYTSTARTAFSNHIPAVIGMQVKILDKHAIRFAQEFYDAWSDGEPIESAMAFARSSMRFDAPGSEADWSIPVLYMAQREGLTLRLKEPATKLPAPISALNKGYLKLAALAGILTVIFFFAFDLPDRVNTIRAETPLIKCVWPLPMQPDPSFNIAVAEFSVQTETNALLKKGDGLALASDLYRRLNANVAGLNISESFNYQIRSPEQACVIQGDTPEERASDAQRVAEKIGADVLVYGTLSPRENRADFVPEFYINYKGFEQGDEVTGDHQLGKPLLINLPIEEAGLQLGGNKGLTARNRAVVHIIIGLAYYSLDDYDLALEQFQSADDLEGWAERRGKEVLYLLLGNTFARKASQVREITSNEYDQILESAQNNYRHALELNSTYVRAQLGLANVMYLKALGNPHSPEGHLNLGLLSQAEGAFVQSLQLPAPDSANIPAKVSFGLGLIHRVKAVAAQANDQSDSAKNQEEQPGSFSEELDVAESKFQEVVDEYQAGDSRLELLASHAYAQLSYVWILREDYPNAIEMAKNALELTSPYYKGRYSALLGDIYLKSGDKDMAIRAYRDGIGFAEAAGDENTVNDLEIIIDRLEP